jgi:hypothetical protein
MVTATVQGQTGTTEMTLNKVGNKWMMDGEEAFGQS